MKKFKSKMKIDGQLKEVDHLGYVYKNFGIYKVYNGKWEIIYLKNDDKKGYSLFPVDKLKTAKKVINIIDKNKINDKENLYLLSCRYSIYNDHKSTYYKNFISSLD